MGDSSTTTSAPPAAAAAADAAISDAAAGTSAAGGASTALQSHGTAAQLVQDHEDLALEELAASSTLSLDELSGLLTSPAGSAAAAQWAGAGTSTPRSRSCGRDTRRDIGVAIACQGARVQQCMPPTPRPVMRPPGIQPPGMRPGMQMLRPAGMQPPGIPVPRSTPMPGGSGSGTSGGGDGDLGREQ